MDLACLNQLMAYVLLNMPCSELAVPVDLLLTQLEDHKSSEVEPKGEEALGKCPRGCEDDISSSGKSLQRKQFRVPSNPRPCLSAHLTASPPAHPLHHGLVQADEIQPPPVNRHLKPGRKSKCMCPVHIWTIAGDVCICLCIRCILDLGSVTMDKVNSVSIGFGFLVCKVWEWPLSRVWEGEPQGAPGQGLALQSLAIVRPAFLHGPGGSTSRYRFFPPHSVSCRSVAGLTEEQVTGPLSLASGELSPRV
jgi:hypothetical protein